MIKQMSSLYLNYNTVDCLHSFTLLQVLRFSYKVMSGTHAITCFFGKRAYAW